MQLDKMELETLWYLEHILKVSLRICDRLGKEGLAEADALNQIQLELDKRKTAWENRNGTK